MDNENLNMDEDDLNEDELEVSERESLEFASNQIWHDDAVNSYRPLSKEWIKIKADKMSERFGSECVNPKYDEFRKKYGPEILASLSGEDLLETMFIGKRASNLCIDLEQNYQDFGKHGTGKMGPYVYYLYFGDGQWKTTYNDNGSAYEHSLSGENAENEAEKIGEIVRDALVEGATIIDKWIKEDGRNYRNLSSELTGRSFSKNLQNFYGRGWVLKYYHMIFPDYMTNFYSDKFINPVLDFLRVPYNPNDHRIIRIGQINEFRKNCGVSSNIVFSQVMYSVFFSSPLFCFNLSGKEDRFNGWLDDELCGIGYKELGDLGKAYERYVDRSSAQWGNIYMKNFLISYKVKNQKDRLEDFETLFMPNAVDSCKYFVVISGTDILGIGKFKIEGTDICKDEFVYDSSSEFGNYCKVEWLDVPDHAAIPCDDDVRGNGRDFYRFNCMNNNIPYLLDLTYSIKDKPYRGTVIETKNPVHVPNPRSIYVNAASWPYNRIVFGAPGTGKSFFVEAQRKELLGDGSEKDYERVTFYPDYSYANFVGTYKPVPKSEDGKEVVTYEYVPGPFMRIYVEASKHPEKPYLLVIEEINRANAAAVFGDVFQLLDRVGDKEDEHFGESMYPIQASEDMKKYLAEKLGGSADDYSKIKIPGNMFIWATMNSADQGVYSLDTAFKRRWDFEYIGIDNGEEDLKGKTVRLGKDGKQTVDWNALRKAINDCLANNKINEDKQLGPYFIDPKIVEADAEKTRSEKFIATFKDKVLMYLFEDAGRQIRYKLFGERSRYSEICKKFDEDGVNVFCKEIRECKGVLSENSQVGQSVEGHSEEDV